MPLRTQQFLIGSTLALASLFCSLNFFGSGNEEEINSQPDVTAVPTIVLVNPTLPPIANTDTPEFAILPKEKIEIKLPGNSSTVSSPLKIEGFAEPTFEQNLVVELSDISGSSLVIEPTTIQSILGSAGPFELTLDFIIPNDLSGRISVYDISARDGGLIHLASINVKMSVSGIEEITDSSRVDETISIFTPEQSDEIDGGVLVIEGFSEYFFEANLGVMLCGAGAGGAFHKICGTEENVLADSFATIYASDIGIPGPFSTAIIYSVTELTPARISVYAISPMDGRIIHLNSKEITLLP